LLNGFAERTHDGFIEVLRNAERFQDLIRAIVAYDFGGENSFYQLRVQFNFWMNMNLANFV